MKLKELELQSHLPQEDVACQDVCIVLSSDIGSDIKLVIEQADMRSAIASLIEKLIESETICYSCRTSIPKNPEGNITELVAKAFRNYKDEKELPKCDDTVGWTHL